jgi:glycosyltransferase involved in cell wall biosynthesis
MKILYDHQTFTLQKYGGISRYFYELIREFDKVEGIKTNLPLIVSNNHYISDKQYVKFINFLPSKYFRGKYRLFNIVNKLNTILELRKQNFDIFHPTYYDPYFLKYLQGKPFVLTVYDMIHEKFREMFRATDKTIQNKKLLIDEASKIIAISESTKNDLIKIYGTDESKIEVVYLGNSMFPKSEIQINFEIPKKYILFVGTRGIYKNFERFIKSISQILNQNKELFVLCAGGGKFTRAETQFLSDLGVIRKVLQYDVNDDILAYFYKNALAFIFPSLYEGFGIPILESFACGCPVICSYTSSLPEIAGEAACYFDPYSELSIRNMVLKVLEDTSLRHNLILKGYERLKKFSWQQTAEQTKKIYESVLI